MNDLSLKDLNEKIVRMEKQYKQLRLKNILVYLLLGIFLLYGFQNKFEIPKVLEVDKIIIKTKDGKETATFGIENDYNDQTKKNDLQNIKLRIKGEINRTYLHGEWDNYRSNISQLTSRGLQIALIDNDGEISNDYNIRANIVERINVSSDLKKSNSLGMFPTISLSRKDIDGDNFNTEISPQDFQISSGWCKIICKIEGNKSNISIFDKDNKLRTIIGAAETTNKYGKTVYHPESTIWLFDENGTGIWTAPNN